MTLRRTLAAALAAAAIAAPAASAQPFDTQASARLAAVQEQRRDLRSPDAIDAAIHPKSAPFIPVSPGHPSEADHTTPLPAVADEKPATTGGSVDWATLGLGIVGLVLFMAGVVALATRNRATPRVSV